LGGVLNYPSKGLINKASYRLSQYERTGRSISDYGKRIKSRQIKSISDCKYLEKHTELSLLGFDYSWASESQHHLSAVKCGDSIFIEIDRIAKGKQLNSFLLG
jgi:hypothetical protein